MAAAASAADYSPRREESLFPIQPSVPTTLSVVTVVLRLGPIKAEPEPMEGGRTVGLEGHLVPMAAQAGLVAVAVVAAAAASAAVAALPEMGPMEVLVVEAAVLVMLELLIRALVL